ncbi:orotidine-5'-phosphate decarboxylase [Corynebacterium sp. 13CS0277]|uniref:orotidine-5'-phosphate decarboxylase n=1 Tax=Corynebacterium sp. 13CS0277 TaxID=2071994 RepID=UPI000D02513B|nr:orotidine-5'-phosphate decarboxylase [Corynebacterium sp. 13CS0277]PRQ11945.1 orotidine-5'-phosphate decarboxylase [Corynebacterium sp. 13CS0277]
MAATDTPQAGAQAAVTPFGERLLAAARERGGRLCVGIDPHASLLEAWGLSVDVTGLRSFSNICVEAFRDTAALVKPQVAFFEAFGSRGLAVLEDTIGELRDAGALVVADAKRGDIGSTMAGYATAWLEDSSPLCSDAVTLSPYLGYHSLDPAIHVAEATGRGIFVLAATSNPEGRQVQDNTNSHGVTVSQQIVDLAGRTNAAAAARGQAGTMGVVVGATLSNPPQLDELHGPILMPGVGAQGGSAEDVARIAGRSAHLVFPNISRGILSAGPDVEQLRAAVAREAAAFPVD